MRTALFVVKKGNLYKNNRQLMGFQTGMEHSMKNPLFVGRRATSF